MTYKYRTYEKFFTFLKNVKIIFLTEGYFSVAGDGDDQTAVITKNLRGA